MQVVLTSTTRLLLFKTDKADILPARLRRVLRSIELVQLNMYQCGFDKGQEQNCTTVRLDSMQNNFQIPCGPSRG